MISVMSKPWKTPYCKTILVLLLALLAWTLSASTVVTTVKQSPLKLEILSQAEFSGIAGDFVTLQAQITNTGKSPVENITTFMALVDTENKMPVDLEDWSAERGLFIGSIDAGQTLPLVWKIHFVKAGTYELFVIANQPESPLPIVSTITRFDVKPKKNLNPGQVLPVALGTPILLICLLMILNYRRLRKT
jgi:hypothetical protein